VQRKWAKKMGPVPAISRKMGTRKKNRGRKVLEPMPIDVVETDRSRAAIRFLLPLAVFCWPILYLFRHIFPINGQYTAIGNDFIYLYYKYKVYLLACLSDFSFPLWSPAEGAGFPFCTNPFAQAFYPFNLLLVVWYKIANGYNPIDHQVFTVLGISIFALGLFMWLRLVNTNLRAVVFAALVMSVSFKMTEIMRFPNAVHSAAWYPWIFYALTKIMLSRSLKKTALNGILLTLFLIFLCTAGYPYYLYYCQFLFLPYMLVFLLKPLRLRLVGIKAVNWKRTLGTLAVVGLVTALICGPYLVGIKHLMSETTDRSGKDFPFSTQHEFSFEDTLGSLMYPPAAMQDGWNFFSITALLLVFLFMLSARAAHHNLQQINDEEKEAVIQPCPRDLWVKLFFIVWISVIIYISYGRRSYLFILLWKFMPGFSSLRIWPRFNIILVPIFAWLLSLAYASFESVISGKDVTAVRKHSWISSPIVALVAAYAAVLGVQLYLYLNEIYDRYWISYFKHLSPQRILFIVYGAVGFVIILLLVIFNKWIRRRSGRSLKAVLAVLLLVAVVEMRPVGTHIWTYQGKPQKNRVHLGNIAKVNEASFRFRRTDHYCSISLRPNFSTAIIANWYFDRYVKFLKETEDELQARRKLLGVQDGTRIFFSESIQHPTVQSFLRDAMRYPRTGRLVSYTGDVLRWDIQTPIAGYLSFIDNWDPGWKVSVDGEPAEIELLFGTFKSVRLAPGRHGVRFYYKPRILFSSRKDKL